MVTAPKLTVLGVLTGETCGDACWHAREDICRCSCGGKNHGCLRTADGVQPVRTRRIGGRMYRMVAVESYALRMAPGAAPICSIRPMEDTKDVWDAKVRQQHLAPTKERTWNDSGIEAVVMKIATKDETARWPELAAWREYPYAGWYDRPLVIWAREDVRE